MYYIVKESSEIPLKSWRTRPIFERKLLEAIRVSVRDHGIPCSVQLVQGVIYVDCKREAHEALLRVFGVHNVCEAVKQEFQNLEDIGRYALEVFKERVKGRKSAVRVKRSGTHGFTSIDVARVVGALLKPYSAGVDLTNPEVTVRIEVRDNTAYYILRCWNGPGGLPVGVEGRVLAMFSGGYDSTLSAWLAAKRGSEVDFLHYYMGSEEASLSAFRVLQELVKWLKPYRPLLYLADLTPVMADIRGNVRSEYRQVALRWVMHLIAQRVARKGNYDAVIVGESVGQASSQTLKNLKVVEKLLKEEFRVPIIRPVAMMDKIEIINKVRSIGLYELCEKVVEVCQVSEGPVTTRADERKLAEELRKLDLGIVDTVLENLAAVGADDEEGFKEVIKSFAEDVEVSEVPEGAILVDVRSREAHLRDRVEGAIHVSQLDLDRVSRGRPLILFCERGGASTVWAKALRRLGYEAYSFKGGLEELRKKLT